MGQVVVRATGTTSVDVDGEPIELRPRERAVLAAIALTHPSPTSIEVITRRVWGDDPPATARQSLHNHVGRLRRVLPEGVLVTEGQAYRLADGVLVDVGGSGTPFSELAPDTDVEGRRLVITEARSSSALDRSSGGGGDVLESLVIAAEDDPFNERLWEQLARHLHATGRRRDASQVLARARRRLAEAGLRPGLLLEDAERALLDDSQPVTGRSLHEGSSSPIDAQDRIAAAVVAHPAPIVIVHGPAGIGKTRTIEEISARAAAAGHRVVAARCDPEPIRPLAPIADIVGQLVEREPLALSRIPDPGPLTLLDESIARLVGRTRAVRDPERRRMGDAVEALIHVGVTKPLMIVVDDLQWASPATVDLVLQLARRHTGVRVVAGWRGGVPPTVEALDGVAVVEAAGFARPELDALLPEQAAPDVADRLFVLTGGNPLFVREVLRQMPRDGSDAAAIDAALEQVPDSVAQLLAAVIGRLDRETSQLVAAAAVLGTRSARVDLAAMVPVGGLATAIDAGVLVPDGNDHVAFRHDLWRRAMLQSLLPAHLEELHDLVVQLLERKPDRELVLDDLAYHAVAAGRLDPVGAAHYAGRAAERLRRSGSHHEAAELLDRAIEVVSLRTDLEFQSIELRIEQGAAALAAGHGDARETLVRALDDAKRFGHDPLVARAAIELCRLGPTSESGDRDEVAAAAVEAALDRRIGRSLRARVAATATMVYSLSNEHDRCRELMTEARAIASDDGSPELLAEVLPFSYMSIARPEDLGERMEIGDQLLAVGDELDRDDTRWEARQIRFSNALQQGVPGLRSELAVLEELAAGIQERTRDWEMHYLRATVAQLDGRLDDAEAIMTASVAYADCVAPSRVMAVFGVHLLAIRHLQGRTGELLPDLTALADEQPLVGAWHAARGLAAVSAGDRATAMAAFDTVVADDLALLERDFVFTGALMALGQTAALLDDKVRAEQVLAHLDPLAERWSWVGTTTLGPMALAAVPCRRLVGRGDEASDLADTALRQARRLDALPYVERLVELSR